jgi:hypothetical protein
MNGGGIGSGRVGAGAGERGGTKGQKEGGRGGGMLSADRAFGGSREFFSRGAGRGREGGGFWAGKTVVSGAEKRLAGRRERGRMPIVGQGVSRSMPESSNESRKSENFNEKGIVGCD